MTVHKHNLERIPDHDGMNKSRAEWAMIALQAFAAATKQDIELESDEVIADLICDLAHLIDSYPTASFDLGKLLRRANDHYLAETDGCGAQFNGVLVRDPHFHEGSQVPCYCGNPEVDQ